MHEDTLTEMGLSQNEAKVYLAMVELGSTSISEISKQSKIHRTNIYDAVQRLKAKGLVCTTKKGGRLLYEASDPEKLLNYWKEKETKLLEVIPQLKLHRMLSGSDSEAMIYEGVVANRRLLEGFLKCKDDILGYGYPKDNTSISGLWWISNFHKQRIKNKQKMLHIYNENARERIKLLNSMPYTEAKYLPKEFNSPVSIETCGDEVLITDWNGAVVSILIRNKSIAATFKNYFKLLYSLAKT